MSYPENILGHLAIFIFKKRMTAAIFAGLKSLQQDKRNHVLQLR